MRKILFEYGLRLRRFARHYRRLLRENAICLLFLHFYLLLNAIELFVKLGIFILGFFWVNVLRFVIYLSRKALERFFKCSTFKLLLRLLHKLLKLFRKLGVVKLFYVFGVYPISLKLFFFFHFLLKLFYLRIKRGIIKLRIINIV